MVSIDFQAAGRKGSGNSSCVRRLIESLLDLGRDHAFVPCAADPSWPKSESIRDRANVSLRRLIARTLDAHSRPGFQNSGDELDILHGE